MWCGKPSHERLRLRVTEREQWSLRVLAIAAIFQPWQYSLYTGHITQLDENLFTWLSEWLIRVEWEYGWDDCDWLTWNSSLCHLAVRKQQQVRHHKEGIPNQSSTVHLSLLLHQSPSKPSYMKDLGLGREMMLRERTVEREFTSEASVSCRY